MGSHVIHLSLFIFILENLSKKSHPLITFNHLNISIITITNKKLPFLGYIKLYHILYMDLDIFNDGISLKFIKEFIIEITR
jgi:hypothetical protein